MDFAIIIIISLIFLVILKIIFGYKIKKLKEIGKDEKLDEISKKYPSNLELCKSYLKKLNNENVKIEENNEAQASLYIAISNKIVIANIQNTYTRIQTIAHECLHSIQDKKILMFNFIFSNIYIIYYITICILAMFKMLNNKSIYLNILFLLSMIYYLVRVYLENDAMIKARFLAKEYMEEAKISSKEEIQELVAGFDKINNMGIKCINYNFFLGAIIKIIIYCLICLI